MWFFEIVYFNLFVVILSKLKKIYINANNKKRYKDLYH